MGIRSSAANKLEQAMAAAFATYFAGDPDFTKSDGIPFFVAAQSVSRLVYPQVCFMCLEAVEEVALSAVYTATLHVVVDTALNERSDDYPSVINLHDARVNKCVNLMGNFPVLSKLTNAPASGADNRTVVNFTLYGIGKILKEQNKAESNRLCFIQSINVGFQPV